MSEHEISTPTLDLAEAWRELDGRVLRAEAELETLKEQRARLTAIVRDRLLCGGVKALILEEQGVVIHPAGQGLQVLPILDADGEGL